MKKNVKRGVQVVVPPSGALPLATLRALVCWFGRQRRILPWREEPTLYRVWISEIMLQQTQVVTVLPYFERFMKAFPTVRDLARADEEKVLKAWEGLGYYSRARNLHRAAKVIDERARLGDEDGFPRTRDEWLEIPGVGPYTAGAVTSIALGLPEPIVDGNVERVFSRLRRLRRSKGEAAYKTALWGLSEKAVRAAHAKGLSPSDLNQAWMELGATICTPKKPACLLCPIRGECEAWDAGEVELYPEKKKRVEWVTVQEERVAWIDEKDARVYLEKVKAGEWRQGLWDFPVGSARGTRRKASGYLGEILTRHVVTHHKIERRLKVFSRSSSQLSAEKLAEGRWVSVHHPEVPLGSASRGGVEALRERYF